MNKFKFLGFFLAPSATDSLGDSEVQLRIELDEIRRFSEEALQSGIVSATTEVVRFFFQIPYPKKMLQVALMFYDKVDYFFENEVELLQMNLG